MKVGELCAGYGGIGLGLELAGEDVDLRWLSEIDPALDPVHPPGVPNLGDMKLIDWSIVEPVDLLTAGFPCQPISAAGRQLAQADERWLWPEIHRAIAALKPSRVLLENVRNLVSIQKGTVWAYILDDLATLGYDVTWLTLGACAVGAAHHRHRVFALAIHTEWSEPRVTRLDVQECGARRGAVMVPTATALDARGSRNETAWRSPGRGGHNSGTTLTDFARLLPTPAARDGDGRGEGDQTYWTARGTERNNGLPLGAALALLPTPTTGDQHVNAVGERVKYGVGNLRTVAGDSARWGRFADAIERHAATFGVPPAPTEPNRNGAPRLTAAFAEWLMCLPAGHVTAKLLRTQALKAIGNGVCPPQLAQAWRYLTNLDRPSDMSLESHGMTTSTGVQADVNEIQQRNATARGRVIVAAYNAQPGQDLGDTEAATMIEAALMELAQVWIEEAQYFTEQKRRGWKSTSEELTRCAARLRGFAVGLTTREVTLPSEPTIEGLVGESSLGQELTRLDNLRGVGTLGPLEVHEPQCQCGRPECVGLSLDPAIIEAIPGALTADNFLPEPPPVEHHAGEIAPAAVQIFGPMFPGQSGYRAAEHDRSKAPCYECAEIGEDPAPWCDCSGFDESCKGPCRKQAHTYEFHKQGCTHNYRQRGETKCAYCGEALERPVAVDNPFTSPAAPGTNRAPVKRLGYDELGPLIAATFPVPRPHLSHSFVESAERCGLSALLSDASRAGHLGPRRPSWSLLGGNAFHLAIESIERTSIELGGTSPLTTDWNGVAGEWEKFWDDVLASVVDEQKAALIGTAYAQPSAWHVANKGLEGFDWWRVEGLAMLKRYLEFHDNTWRSKHTLLQVPQDPTAAQPQRVPVLEFGFTTTAGSTAIIAEGRIDAAWLSTTDEYPTATLEVIDHKAGKSVPSEHFQLTEYADVLRRRYLPPGFALPTVGRYWLARQGRYTPPVKLDPAAAQAEIDYRYTMANRKVSAGVFEPSPSNFCASCSSVDYCPAQAMRDA